MRVYLYSMNFLLLISYFLDKINAIANLFWINKHKFYTVFNSGTTRILLITVYLVTQTNVEESHWKCPISSFSVFNPFPHNTWINIQVRLAGCEVNRTFASRRINTTSNCFVGLCSYICGIFWSYWSSKFNEVLSKLNCANCQQLIASIHKYMSVEARYLMKYALLFDIVAQFKQEVIGAPNAKMDE